MEDIYARGEVVSGSITLSSKSVFKDDSSDECCKCSETSIEITPRINTVSDGEKSTTSTAGKISSYLWSTLYSQTNLFSSKESDIVEQYLLSLVEQNKDLMILKNHNILIRRDHESLDQVKILSGGAAGHEPLHTGFVGEGMLTAAVIGNINICPSHQSILNGIRELSVNNDNGIIVICMNYAADRSNFGLAVQMAAREGIRVLCLVVGDDCSGIITDKLAGRRGLAGVVLVQKVASAMAAAKKTLYEIFYICQALSGKHLGTINVGLPSSSIDKMEVGIGLKGEQGITKSDVTDMTTVIQNALWYLLHVASYFALHIKRGDSIVLLVNNFHMLTDLELNVVVLDVLNILFHYELNVLRIYAGNYLTCKICYGFSVTILKIDNKNLIKWLDYPVQVPGWENKVSKFESSIKEKINFYVRGNYPQPDDSVTQLGPKFTFKEANKLISMLSFIMNVLINTEGYLNSIDFDHDCGSAMKNFAVEILDAIENGRVVTETPHGLFNYLSVIAANKMGGMSTSVYFILFSAAAQAFIKYPSCKRISVEMFIEALSKAYETLVLFTRAKPGNRTVIDAIYPCLNVLKEAPRDLGRAVEAAKEGSQSTIGMNPSTKLPASVELAQTMPDAGAEAFVVWFRAACDAFIFSKPEKDIQSNISSDENDEYVVGEQPGHEFFSVRD